MLRPCSGRSLKGGCFYSRRARNAPFRLTRKRDFWREMSLASLDDFGSIVRCPHGGILALPKPWARVCAPPNTPYLSTRRQTLFSEASISAAGPMCMAASWFGPAYQRTSDALTSSDSNRCRLRSAFLNRGSNGWQCRVRSCDLLLECLRTSISAQ